MSDNGKPIIATQDIVRKAPTPEQQARREANDLRNERIQSTRIPQPSTGIWGSQKNQPQKKVA